jgi:hypothetical protein
MLDDLRNHDATPTAEERQWMATDPFTLVIRTLTLAGVALLLGLSAHELLGPGAAIAGVVAAATE